MTINIKVFNPWHPVMDAAADWGLKNTTTDHVNDQPFKVAAVPVMFDVPESYNYYKDMCGLDLSRFDLVLMSDIEYTNYTQIYEWIGKHNVKSFAVAVGGLFSDIPLDQTQMVYRPWWMKNVIDLNKNYDPGKPSTCKPYLFDALLGTRRPHRDFVMLQMQRHSKLMQQSIVNYRDVFTPGKIPLSGQISKQIETQKVAELFPDIELRWPYVSDNLHPNWEVSDKITHSVSQHIPATIYENTWYSILCETIHTGTTFFMAEKFTKTVLARRAFVMFGPVEYLSRLRELGFQTFSSVIDESYDLEPIDIQRYQLAWAQVLSLSQQDPWVVNQRLDQIFDHNKKHLMRLWDITLKQRQELLCRKIPAMYLTQTL